MHLVIEGCVKVASDPLAKRTLKMNRVEAPADFISTVIFDRERGDAPNRKLVSRKTSIEKHALELSLGTKLKAGSSGLVYEF